MWISGRATCWASAGGSWGCGVGFLQSCIPFEHDPSVENSHVGFCIATVPEPSTYGLAPHDRRRSSVDDEETAVEQQVDRQGQGGTVANRCFPQIASGFSRE